jgi:hypothetical protein
MKIRYKRRRQNYNLAFGIVWAVIGLLGLTYGGENKITDYLFLIMSVSYFGLYFYERTNQYLNISENQIKINLLFKKKINLSEITWIKKFASDYILKTDKTELTINTDIIEKHSLIDLNNILASLNLPADKTPFKKAD